jgi:hypothetical protein
MVDTKFLDMLPGMEEMILEEVRQFTAFLRQFATSTDMGGGQPLDMSSQFNLPILNALWRVTVGDRLEYTDPRLLDIVHRIGVFLQKLANPVGVLAVTVPWLFKAGLCHLRKIAGFYFTLVRISF